MSWLKRLFGLDDEEVGISRQNKKLDEQYLKGWQKNLDFPSKTEAKVIYEYPKGHFRFPVIPDEKSSHEIELRRPEKSIKQSSELPKTRKMKERYYNRIENENFRHQKKRSERSQSQADHSVAKKRFKPSDVPSPIYGFHRPKKEIEDSLEQARVECLQTPDEPKEQRTTSILKPVFEGTTAKTQDEEKSSLQKEYESIARTSEKQIEKEREMDEVPNVQQSTNHVQVETKKIANVSHENKDHHQAQKKTVIPFNVLMNQQDKARQSSDSTQQTDQIKKPPLNLLEIPPVEPSDDQQWIEEQTSILNRAFESFHVGAKVVKATKGPAVTQFEVQPEFGVRVNKITNLTDDLKLALAAKDIRIEAPIPGKSTVGIEVPNRKSRTVVIREVLRSPIFQKSTSPLTVALGLDLSGEPVVTDIKKMPHGLIAGATGSGKSVCINAIIISLLYKASPQEVKLMLIDPKMVEMASYYEIPHLVSPVITDVKAATAALKWAVDEMERRYELLAHESVRDIDKFNEKILQENPKAQMMPYIVIIIDELADLMMVSPTDVEDAISRIAQKARACGIHLIVATQRPSVDVITGLIKANIPTRIAFSVSSQVDSRTIIDISGAEKLLGKGDMLLLENGANKPVRIQGNFVNDEEIERVTEYVKKQMKPNYLFQQEELMKQSMSVNGEDELFEEACRFVIEQQSASASSLQRRFRIGYNRAARLVDMMEAQGIVSASKGSKPREILISKDQLDHST